MAGISSGYFHLIQFATSKVIVNIVATAQIRNIDKG